MMLSKKGFTLVELLVVISIIGILTGIVIAVLNPARVRGKAWDGRRKSDIKVIQSAIEFYYTENNQYPPTGTVPFGGSWDPYLKNVPQEKKAGHPQYCYLKLSTHDYRLCVELENDFDPERSLGSCGGRTYDYCAENPF